MGRGQGLFEISVLSYLAFSAPPLFSWFLTISPFFDCEILLIVAQFPPISPAFCPCRTSLSHSFLFRPPCPFVPFFLGSHPFFSPTEYRNIVSGSSFCVCSQPSFNRRRSLGLSRNLLLTAGTRDELLKTCAYEAIANLGVV